MIQRARHDKAQRAADRDLARAAAHFSGTASGNGSESGRGSKMMAESPSRQAVIAFDALLGHAHATEGPHIRALLAAEQFTCAGAKACMCNGCCA